MNHSAARRHGRFAAVGAWALVSLALAGLGCHRRHRDVRGAEGEAVVAPAEAAPQAMPEARGSGAEPGGDGSGSGSAAPPAFEASQPYTPPGPPPPGPPRRSSKEKAQDVGVAVSTGVGALLDTVAANAPRTEVRAGASMSVSTQCYDHDCNGARTGRKCFGNHASYCASLCREGNCVSRAACQSECR